MSLKKLLAVITISTAALLTPKISQAGICDAFKIAKYELDSGRLNDFDKFYAVYFWFGDIPLKERPFKILTLAGALRGLSTSPSLTYFPQVVTKDYTLVRINYKEYGWTMDLIRRLIAADPYREYDLCLENVVWPGGIWPDGKYYEAGGIIKSIQIPVVSASWFIWQTGQQDDRDPGYLDFLGLKDRKAMDDLSGFSSEVNKRALKSDWVEVPQFSKLSRRRVRTVLVQSVSGGVRYGTEDSRKSIKQFNPFVPRTEFTDHDAEEWIFDLPNFFKGFFLSDKAGKKQDFAPAEIVGFDASSPNQDGLIHVGVSCYRCHFRKGSWGVGSAGVIDFVPHYRKTFSGGFRQNSPIHDRVLEFDRLYLRPFQDEFVISKLRTNVAVISVTGMSADEWALRLTNWFEAYDWEATLEEASLFLACDGSDLISRSPDGKILFDKEGKPVAGPILREALKKYAEQTGLLDNTLSLFAQGVGIPRDNYHEVYPILASTWRGIKNAKPFNPVDHVFPPGDDASDVKLWLLRGKLPLELQLPKLPKLPKLSAVLPTGELQLQLQLHLPRRDTTVLSELPATGSGYQRLSQLQPADPDQPVLNAVSVGGFSRLCYGGEVHCCTGSEYGSYPSYGCKCASKWRSPSFSSAC